MKPLGPKETEIQQQLMRWWALQHRALGVPREHLLMAFPMQGGRSPRNGARMKAEGMRKGLPDMFLAVPVARLGWHGLWIELKRPGGRVSPEQSDFLHDLRAQGYVASVCYGFEEAVNEIKAYLEYAKRK